MGTYIPTMTPTFDPTSDPTMDPTNHAMVLCGNGNSGGYNGGTLQIEIQTTFENQGDIELDASLSTFTVIHLQAFDANNVLLGVDGGSGDWNVGKNDQLRLNNVMAGKYKFLIKGTNNGFYAITTKCYDKNEEKAISEPTNNPSSSPTTSPLKSDNDSITGSNIGLTENVQILMVVFVALIVIFGVVGCTVCFVVKSKKKININQTWK